MSFSFDFDESTFASKQPFPFASLLSACMPGGPPTLRTNASPSGNPGAQYNVDTENSIDFSIKFCRTVGHPVKLNRNLKRIFNRVFNIQFKGRTVPLKQELIPPLHSWP